MRITSLELAPYGHLARARLEFSTPAGGPGLHVIRGRNGAGKSTTMRALDGAMFGIPRRTPDTHTHLGQALKVGFSLQTGGDQLLTLERRKRDGQSLFQPDGSPVDEAVLREALGGLPPDEFRAMFLLDCEKLEAGSADLLAGRGLLGQALFGAALGFGRVHSVLTELEQEAEAIWIKNGSREIQEQLKLLKDARQHRRQERLDPEIFARLEAELEETERRIAELKLTQRDLAQRLERTKRHERCLAPLARRKQVVEQLGLQPPTPDLPASFTAEVSAAHAELETVDALIAETSENLEQVNADLAANPEPGPIADRETAINALYQRAGESTKAASDLPRREAELATCDADLKKLFAKAGAPADIESIDGLRVTDADRAGLIELISNHARLDQASETANQNVARLRRKLKDLDQRKPNDPPLSKSAQHALTDAVEEVRVAGDLEAIADEAGNDARSHWEEARRSCSALPIWDGELDALERLTVPALATLQRFERDHSQIEHSDERLADRLKQLDDRRAALEDRGRSLAAGPDAPARAVVTSAREERDQAITALIDAPGAEAAADLRSSIRIADDLADARADHAETAAVQDQLEHDLAAVESDHTQLVNDKEAHVQAKVSYEQRWAEQWPSLPRNPLTPLEMREWLSQRSAILETVRRARQAEARSQQAERSIHQHRAALVEQLGSRPDSFDDSRKLKQLLRDATQLLADDASARDAVAEHNRDRSRLREDLAEATAQVAQAEDALVSWAGKWAPAVQALGLHSDATLAQAQAQLSVIDELMTTFDNAAALKHRVERMREDQAGFAADAKKLASELALDLAGSEPTRIAEELHARAAAARSGRAAREQLEPQHRKLSEQAEKAAAKRGAATGQLEGLARQAGIGIHDLAALCQTIEERQILASELRAVESELVAAGAASVGELLTELDQATPESLAAARTDDESEAQRLEDQRSALERKAGVLREQFAGTGDDGAALAAEQEAQARAALAAAYERYTDLSLAAALLRQAIEQHRKQNQGPLLQRAGELFARLSGGWMSGLTVVTSEKDPHIMGVRPDQREVPVDGMSSGQRHQLFLALRLASLERHFEHNEPMPLILDDLLVQLDDVSAHVALEIFAELSRNVQVLFFTHHDHLVTMARNAVPPDLLVEHEIGEGSRPALQAA